MVTVQPEYQSIIGKAEDVSFRDNMYINRAYLCSCKHVMEYRLSAILHLSCIANPFTI